jgi:hypothetical protein
MAFARRQVEAKFYSSAKLVMVGQLACESQPKELRVERVEDGGSEWKSRPFAA